MRVATFNTNSIRPRMEIIKDWIEKANPDILCIQETKVQDKDFPSAQFEDLGYNAFFKGQKSYNGVAIISRLHLNNVRKNLTQDLDEQARFISGQVLGLSVINVYVPQGFAPGSDKFLYKLSWLKGLLSLLESAHDPSLPLLLLGDFNVALEDIDLYDPEGLRGEVGFHPDEQEMMKKFFKWGLIDIFRKHQSGGGHYTFWDYRIPNGFKRKMGWRIDYILATRPLAERSINAWIDTEPRIKKRPSDHTFLVAEFDI